MPYLALKIRDVYDVVQLDNLPQPRIYWAEVEF